MIKKLLFFVVYSSLLIFSNSFAEELQYTVVRGDTIYSIARAHNLSSEELMSINDISDPRDLKAGDVLFIGGSYLVERGDTLYSISRRYSMSVDELRSLNDIDEDGFIRVGQRLIVSIDSSGNSMANTVASSVDSTESTDNIEKPVGTVEIEETDGTFLVSQQTNDGADLLWPHPGERYVFNGKFPGIMIKGNRGDEITATSNGKVIYSGPHSTLGRVVFIQNSRGYIYIYGGNDELMVETGDDVVSGAQVGTLGITPLLQESQVYFSIWKDGSFLDPTTAPR